MIIADKENKVEEAHYINKNPVRERKEYQVQQGEFQNKSKITTS